MKKILNNKKLIEFWSTYIFLNVVQVIQKQKTIVSYF